MGCVCLCSYKYDSSFPIFPSKETGSHFLGFYALVKYKYKKEKTILACDCKVGFFGRIRHSLSHIFH